MKRAEVIYLTGASEIPQELEVEKQLAAAGLDPRWTQTAGSTTGWPTLQEAVLDLARRGAHRVDMRAALWEADKGLTLAGSTSRLWG